MHKKGFSLYEILIVIIIIAIVATIGIVFFGRSEPVLHLNSGADMLRADLSLVRQRALSRWSNTAMWEIVIPLNSGQYAINAYDAAGNLMPEFNQVKILPQGIEFRYDVSDFSGLGAWPSELNLAGITPDRHASFGGDNRVRFLSNGRAVNGTNNDFGIGYILMRNELGNVKLFVITGMTGRIKVYTLFTDGSAFE